MIELHTMQKIRTGLSDVKGVRRVQSEDFRPHNECLSLMRAVFRLRS